jgi:transposase
MNLEMSQKERDRLVVVRNLAAGKLTQKQAAALMDLSERQTRRILRSYEEEGDAALVHGARGKPSNNRFPDEFKTKVMQLVRECYEDFGPTLACEKLARHHGLELSRETLRQWMMRSGVWKPKKRKPTYRIRRPRRECFGELVQVDGSHHDWFEIGEGPRPVLLMAVDDATGRNWGRFAPTESTATVMRLLYEYALQFGLPKAIYADRASHFVTTRDATVPEQLKGISAETQIQRALRELGVEYIPAHSPQAKGRVERSFGTHQDRLVKEMRIHGINDIEAANTFLEEFYLDAHNDSFAVDPKLKLDVHRPTDGLDLDAIFSRQHTRVVGNDYTIQFENAYYQIGKQSITGGLRGGEVIVEQRLDGSMHVRFRGKYLNIRRLPPQQPKARDADDESRRSRSSRRRGTAVTPADDHPWKRSYKVAGSG